MPKQALCQIRRWGTPAWAAGAGTGRPARRPARPGIGPRRLPRSRPSQARRRSSSASFGPAPPKQRVDQFTGIFNDVSQSRMQRRLHAGLWRRNEARDERVIWDGDNRIDLCLYCLPAQTKKKALCKRRAGQSPLQCRRAAAAGKPRAPRARRWGSPARTAPCLRRHVRCARGV